MRDWYSRAACRGMEPDLFFPIGTTGSAVEQTEQAKAICAACPVSERCLEWALATGQPHGVWGGKSEDERRALLRRRRRR